MRMVSGLCGFVVLVLFVPAAMGQQSEQTDWSGGGGIVGPVSAWQNRFDAAQGIDWTNQNGPLTLASALPAAHPVTVTFSEPAGAAAGDLDADGDLDIVAVAYGGHQVAWWENDGSGGGWTQQTIAEDFTGACSLCLCDINEDGYLDVAATAELLGSVTWWENPAGGRGWTAHTVDLIAGPFSVRDADFDGDGDLDLCVAAFNANMVEWCENTDGCGGAWLTHPIDATCPGPWWADAGDVDGDGDADVIGVSVIQNRLYWWENEGNGALWTRRVVGSSFPTPCCVRLADMDGDADLDALAAANGGQLAWWERNDQTEVWTKHLVAQGLGGPFSVRAADLDGDGDLDVVGNERNADKVSWYENVDGQGQVWWTQLVDGTSDAPNDVLAADVDGNGIQDVIATFSQSNSVVWYQQTGTPAGSGLLQSSILDCGGPVHDWGNLDWTCDTPVGTSVLVEVRAAGDPADMGAWTEVPSSGQDLSPYIMNLTRYFQYRVTLAAAGDASPGLHDLRLGWDDVTGLHEDASTAGAFYCRVAGNPSSSGEAAFEFALPHARLVSLSLFDPVGRKVGDGPETAYPAGRHSATIRGLRGGIYFYLLQAGDLRSTGKVVVR